MGRNPRIGVVVIDEYPETAETLFHWLQATPDMQVVGQATRAREGIELIRRKHPQVALIAAALPGMDGLKATKIISKDFPVRIIVLADDDSKETLQAAVHAGARDCFNKPTRDDLLAAIRRVAQLPDDRRTPEAPLVVAEQTPHMGQVVVCCGTKGGVGRSTVAANLAVILAETEGKVALVDANVMGGDQHILFNIEQPRGLDVLCSAELDAALISEAAVSCQPHLDLFCAPQQVEQASLFTADAMRAILVELREHYAVIVVDVGASFDAATTATLEAADRLIVLTTLELSAVHQLRHFYETIRHDIPRERCWTVANRMDGAFGITPTSVEKSLGIRFAAVLPEDLRTVNAAVNHGMPFMVTQRRAPIARAMQELGHQVQRDLAQARGQHAPVGAR